MTRLQQQISGFRPGRILNGIRLVFAFLLLAAVSSRAATFTVTLDTDTILLGDTATLSLKFEDGQPAGSPQLPELPGLQVVSSGQSSQFGFSTGGRSVSSVTYSFGVRANQVGEFTIPALTARVGNETLTSEPVSFKVVRAPTPAPGTQAEEQSLVLLRLVLPKTNAYVGEIIVAQLQLLVREGVQNISNPELPLNIDGCIVGQFVQRQQHRTVVGSTRFTMVPLLVPITVMKQGQIKVGPIDGAVVVTLPSRERDPFDPFGMLNRGVQQRVAFSSPAVTLNALPVPAQGKPASFSGAVGQFDMAVSAGPTNVAVGDPVTIRVQIDGQGALDSFTLPEQPAWKEFRVYPPTAKTETRGDLGMEGTKSFEQVVVPENTEIKELPPFEFSYFDPEKQAYQTLRQSAIPLLVRPAGSTPAPTLALNTPKSETPAPAQDIVHIKARLGRNVISSKPWVTQPAFLALQGLPLIALIGAMFWRRRCDRIANNPRLRRQRQVEQVVSDGLARLRQLAHDRNSDEFFALVFRLLQEQIGERLDVPASAITEAVVDERLVRSGISRETASALHELFQQCNQARYAPVQSLHELEAVIPKLEAALAQVREVQA